MLFSRSRGKNSPTDFVPAAGFVSTGVATVVAVGAAKNEAAIVLKSGMAELVELAGRKLKGKKLAADVASPFAATPNCGAFTDTVVLARQISTS